MADGKRKGQKAKVSVGLLPSALCQLPSRRAYSSGNAGRGRDEAQTFLIDAARAASRRVRRRGRSGTPR